MRTLTRLLHIPLLISILAIPSGGGPRWSPGWWELPYGRETRSVWGRGESAAGFSPLQVPGCVLWLDAGCGVYQDDGGGTPSLEDSVVALWKDRTGNGYDAAQGINASRPLCKTGVCSGRTVLRFDGADDHLITPRMEDGFPAGFTWFIVAAVDDGHPAVQQSFFGSINTTGANDLYFYAFNRTDGTLRNTVCENGSPVIQKVTTLSDGPSDFFIMRLCADPLDSLRGFYNGDGVTPADLTGLTWANIAGAYTEEIAVSGRMRDGGFENNYYLDGDIAELIIYGRPLTDMEQDRIENYLSVKYDIK